MYLVLNPASNMAVKHVYPRQFLGNPYISMFTLYKGEDPFNWLGYRCCPTRFLKNSVFGITVPILYSFSSGISS